MHTLADIHAFLAHKRLAVVGLSTDPKHFSRLLARELTQRGYELVPVNPKAADIDGNRCFARVPDVRPAVDAVLVATPATVSAQVIRDCVAAGVRHVWLHRGGGTGAVSDEAVALCREQGIAVIAGECPFMFLPSAGWIHRLHGGLRKLTRSYPN